MKALGRLGRETGVARSSWLSTVLVVAVIAGGINHFVLNEGDPEKPQSLPFGYPQTSDAGITPDLAHGASGGERDAPIRADEMALTRELSRGVAQPPLAGLAAPVEERRQGPATSDPRARSVSAERVSQGLRLPEDRLWLPDEVYEDPAAIAGRVLGSEGEPITGVSVTARVERLFESNDLETANGVSQPMQTWSDANGLYAFRDMPPGVYRVRAEPPVEYDEGVAKLVRTGVHSADLVLGKAKEYWVFGVVEDSAGAPLEGVRVYQGDQPSQEAETDAEGKYSLQLALASPQHNTSVRYRLDGYRDERFLIGGNDWQGQDRLAIDVGLDPLDSLATVRGTVASTEGEPLAGEKVQLIAQGLGRGFHGVTDEEGRFALRDVLTKQDYTVMVRPRGPYQDYMRRDLQVPASGLDMGIELMPVERGKVSGVVTDISGTPIPRLALTVRSMSAMNLSRRVTADQSGWFFVDDMPSGGLLFESQAYPHLSVQGAYLRPGSELVVDLKLDWGVHRLMGEIVDELGNPIPGTRVWLSMDFRNDALRSLSSRMTTADINGVFLFTNLGPGLHQLRVDAPGYEQASLAQIISAPEERVKVFLD